MLKDAFDSVFAGRVLRNDAPDQLGAPEHDVASRLKHVVGGKLIDQHIARGVAVVASCPDNGKGEPFKSFFSSSSNLAAVQGLGEHK